MTDAHAHWITIYVGVRWKFCSSVACHIFHFAAFAPCIMHAIRLEAHFLSNEAVTERIAVCRSIDRSMHLFSIFLETCAGGEQSTFRQIRLLRELAVLERSSWNAHLRLLRRHSTGLVSPAPRPPPLPPPSLLKGISAYIVLATPPYPKTDQLPLQPRMNAGCRTLVKREFF